MALLVPVETLMRRGIALAIAIDVAVAEDAWLHWREDSDCIQRQDVTLCHNEYGDLTTKYKLVVRMKAPGCWVLTNILITNSATTIHTGSIPFKIKLFILDEKQKQTNKTVYIAFAETLSISTLQWLFYLSQNNPHLWFEN